MRLYLLLFVLCVTTQFSAAKKSTKPKKKEIKTFLKGTKKLSGFLDLHTKEGKYYLLLGGKHFKKDFLMTASIAHGIGTGGFFGGTMLHTRVVKFRKIEDEVQFLFRNVSHIAGKDKTLKEALKVAFQDQIFGSYKVLADQGGKVLIDATEFLTSDIYQLSGWLSKIRGGAVSHNAKLSHVREVKNFAENSEVRSNLAFTQRLSAGAKNHFEVLIHYSFFGFPKNKYRPRVADQRVGHFVTALKDYSMVNEPEPYRRYINRWNLQKADSKSKVSLPKKPIIFYLARNIPHKYRKTLREGILEWNKAFEKIGFVGALEARVQMDDEDWEAEDNRYHVVGWITTEKPSYGAIGPSRVNPLTGEILDADILMDESKVRSKIFEFKRNLGQDKPPAPKKLGEFNSLLVGEECHALDVIGEQLGLLMVAQAKVLEAAEDGNANGNSEKASETTTDPKDPKDEKTKGNKLRMVMEEYVLQALKWVMMHEVGHTLGFRHNFKSSVLHDFENLHNKELVKEKGLYGSVMEYPGLNISKDPTKQGYYFSPTLGPYDYWIVEYAYAVFGKGKEGKLLKKIAARSHEKELAYATDEDTRGQEYSDMDPYAALYDLSSDPLKYSKHMVEFISESWTEIVDRVVLEGESFQFVEKAFFSFITTYIRSLESISRFIGGKEFSRIHKGDSKKRPITPVPFATQREALKLLDKFAFHNDFLNIPVELAESMPSSRWWHWGSNIFGKPIDKNVQKIIAYVQKKPLERLLSPRVLERIIDQASLYAKDSEVLTLNEYFSTLMKSVFSGIFPKGFPNVTLKAPLISTSKRDLQREFVTRMIELCNRKMNGTRMIPVDARALGKRTLRRIYYQIDKVQKLRSYEKLDAISKIHLEDTFERIQAFLDSRYVLKNL
jgi:hypothetical protein